MTVSDYILDYLVSIKVKHVFLITGGAVAFIVDAFHNRKDIEYVCVAHEQAAAMAADAYARMGPGIGATMVTSGPGATNLITGICCSWFDSIPTIHFTGQVNTYEQKGKSNVRQVGFQETDIVEIVKPITKFAAQLDKPENIKYLLEKATYIATSGRPGPVVLDIPQDFQRAKIDHKSLTSFSIPKEKAYKDTGKILSVKIEKALLEIKKAKRPVLLVGGGVRISNAVKEIYKLAETFNFPIVASWSGFDVFPHNYPLRVGEFGVYGNRGANFAVQNADMILSIGSRLDTRQTGGKPNTFAREAKLIMVDVDQSELDKDRGLVPYIKIQCDAKEFTLEMLTALKDKKFSIEKEWLKRCLKWKSKYPAVLLDYYKEKGHVNSYVFSKILSEELNANAVIIPDDGGHLTWTMQAFEVKKNQRLFSAFGNSPMGYALPASMGASIALGKKDIICIDGDGSIQINIQELQTIAHNRLPIKIFILNNNGYGIIKQFQELYLGSRYEATGKGVSLPDFVKIGKAYGIKSIRIKTHKELRRKIKQVLRYKGPVICDVLLSEKQKIIPKLEFGKPIEDLAPALSQKEFDENMIIKAYNEKRVKDAGV